MSKNMDKNNNCLCFVEGEPHLYNKITKEYIELTLPYDKVLDLVKEQIPTKGKRPGMAQIWVMLNNLIPCSSRYYSGYNKRSIKSEDCFETKFSRDITAYLDTIWQRGLTPEEIELNNEIKRIKGYNRIYTNFLIDNIMKIKRRQRKRN